ncbi:MAG: hypothetical protein WC795_01290 [Candidatus Paceibacterota bacterium]|jgi:hypothetical protein
MNIKEIIATVSSIISKIEYLRKLSFVPKDPVAHLSISDQYGHSLAKITIGSQYSDRMAYLELYAGYAEDAENLLRNYGKRKLLKKFLYEKTTERVKSVASVKISANASITLAGFKHEVCEAIILSTIWDLNLISMDSKKSHKDNHEDFVKYFEIDLDTETGKVLELLPHFLKHLDETPIKRNHMKL